MTIQHMFYSFEEDGKLSLWDTYEDGRGALRILRFADGRIGLLPPTQTHAMREIRDAGHASAQYDFAQRDRPEIDGIDESHIVHQFRSLMEAPNGDA